VLTVHTLSTLLSLVCSTTYYVHTLSTCEYLCTPVLTNSYYVHIIHTVHTLSTLEYTQLIWTNRDLHSMIVLMAVPLWYDRRTGKVLNASR